MRNFFQKKVWVILLATLALGALTVLAVSLDNVSFHDAQRYSRGPVNLFPFFDSVDGNSEVNLVSVPLWKQVVLWSLVGVLVILAGLLLSPQSRKRLYQMLLRVAVAALAMYLLIKNYPETLRGLFDWQQLGGDPASAANAPPMPEFQPPHVSPILSYLVSLSCALIWIAVMWVLYKGWKRYTALNSNKPLAEIAHIARTSLNDLSTGRDTSDVIINCYLRMSDVVADKRKLRREIAMTPQEFAVRLERAGLPGDAVRRLTGLFEMVRYGDRKSAPKDVTEAVNCLNAILLSCGETL
jgi:Domain of unknown function (DUF4129)